VKEGGGVTRFNVKASDVLSGGPTGLKHQVVRPGEGLHRGRQAGVVGVERVAVDSSQGGIAWGAVLVGRRLMSLKGLVYR
jgi:hypothetical protein